jgi:hypothetical protein
MVAYEPTLQTPYGEIFTAGGQLRAPYVELGKLLGTDPLRPAASTWNRLRDRPFGDDTRILPIPWVLDGDEYARVIARGTAQRARALQMFFADVVLGSQSFVDSVSLSRERFDAIVASHGKSLQKLRAQWNGHDAEEIRFVYGPDLARAPDGRWLVLEDNVGCVGGSADGHMAWKTYLQSVATQTISLSDGEPDLRTAVRKWLHRLNLSSDAERVPVLLGCGDGGDPLHAVRIDEHIRQRLILEQAGLGVVERLRLQEQLCENDAGRIRAIVNFQGESDLIDNAFSRHTALFNAPGTEILGSKALLAHTDDMISFFLHEQPILATAPTVVCDDGLLPDEQRDCVVKSAAGRQGTEVFILHNPPADRRTAISDLVAGSWPDRLFVSQQRIEPSRLSVTDSALWGAPSVELRPLTYVVGWSEMHVGARPVGKAVWGFDAEPKHNLSQGASYVPMQVLTPTAACRLQPGTS